MIDMSNCHSLFLLALTSVQTSAGHRLQYLHTIIETPFLPNTIGLSKMAKGRKLQHPRPDCKCLELDYDLNSIRMLFYSYRDFHRRPEGPVHYMSLST